MDISREKLRELLVLPGHLSEVEFVESVKASEQEKRPLDEIIVDKDLIKDEQLGQLLANSLGCGFVNLRNEKIDEETLRKVPELVSRSRGVVVFNEDQNTVKTGMADPEDMEIRHALEKRFGKKIIPYLITKRDLDLALSKYNTSIAEEAAELIKKLKIKTDDDSADQGIQKILELLLDYGYANKASDIHIEPHDESLAVRFRIDGVMHTALKLEKTFADPIISRIKILSKLRIDEHRGAQDGKFRYRSAGEDIDVRVSIVPITGGENAVLRLLSGHLRQLSLNTLGWSLDDLAKVRKAMMNPHGMMLVTGPTGSGKTTTIYEILKILNTEQVHIATIEDPVEYAIDGVSQIQVNPKTNLTFAQGLRAIVRQDPDIIMVGEIRDKETAQIAINSAMTGHLVLSTMHTNDAVTTIPRLLDMGVEPYLISSTLNLIIAQRLVRKICERCRFSYEAAKDLELIGRIAGLKEMIEAAFNKPFDSITFYKGAGCPACASTGYLNRAGLYEVLEITQNIKDLIISKASSAELSEAAKKDRMTTMLEDGIAKISTGLTTLSEVLRVAMN